MKNEVHYLLLIENTSIILFIYYCNVHVHSPYLIHVVLYVLNYNTDTSVVPFTAMTLSFAHYVSVGENKSAYLSFPRRRCTHYTYQFHRHAANSPPSGNRPNERVARGLCNCKVSFLQSSARLDNILLRSVSEVCFCAACANCNHG